MRNLHEEPAHQRLTDTYVKLVLIAGANEVKIKPLHQPLELFSDVLSLLKRPLGQVVVPAPVLAVFV